MIELTSILAVVALVSPVTATAESHEGLAPQPAQVGEVTPLVAGDPPRWPPHQSFVVHQA